MLCRPLYPGHRAPAAGRRSSERTTWDSADSPLSPPTPIFGSNHRAPSLAATPLQCLKGSRSAHFSTFQSGTDINDIRKVQHIYHTRFRWEKFYHKTGVTQCHRCQDFGHGSSACYQLAKCVKCQEKHFTEQCNKPTGTKPYCVNCGNDHRANSRVCPVYQKRLTIIQANRTKYKNNNNNQQQVDSRKFLINNKEFPTLPTRSLPTTTNSALTENYWHQKTANKSDLQDKCNQANDFFELLQEIEKLNLICNIKKALALIRSLNQKLTEAKTQTEKMYIIMCAFNDDSN